MTSIVRGLVWGGAAGAAGSAVLNLVTYLDMLARARPASEAPQQLVEELALDAGVTIPGSPHERRNRVQALGPISGLLTGIAVGMGAGGARQAGLRPPAWVAVPVIAAVAMAAADVPLAVTKVSDPREWAVSDWLTDGLPHIAFASVVHVLLTELEATTR
jgi:hypothetical protein